MDFRENLKENLKDNLKVKVKDNRNSSKNCLTPHNDNQNKKAKLSNGIKRANSKNVTNNIVIKNVEFQRRKSKF